MLLTAAVGFMSLHHLHGLLILFHLSFSFFPTLWSVYVNLLWLHFPFHFHGQSPVIPGEVCNIQSNSQWDNTKLRLEMQPLMLRHGSSSVSSKMISALPSQWLSGAITASKNATEHDNRQKIDSQMLKKFAQKFLRVERPRYCFLGISACDFCDMWHKNHIRLDFIWTGHFERPPYNESTIRSVYNVREYDVHKFMQIEGPIDMFLLHDWPHGKTDWEF